jgi:hypothetical protein
MKMKQLLVNSVVTVSLVVSSLGLISNTNTVSASYVIAQQSNKPLVTKSNIKLFANDALIANNILIIGEGTSYLPVRAISEALNLNVDWNGDTRTITINKKKAKSKAKVALLNSESEEELIAQFTDIKLFVGKTKVDKKVVIINSRSYLPVRALSEALKLNVGWDGIKREINITPKKLKNNI